MPLRCSAVILSLLLLAACSSLVPPDKPTPSPLIAQGHNVFRSFCARCHSNSGETIIVGPSLAGIASRADSRMAGLDARAYIRRSIMDPGAYVVDGFSDGLMPQNFSEQLTPDQVDAVIEYLLTLK